MRPSPCWAQRERQRDLASAAEAFCSALARQAALDAGALATAATVSLHMAALFTNRAEHEQALEAGRSCAVEAGRLRLPLVEGLGLILQAVAHALMDRQAEMEAAIEKAVTVSGGHPEVHGVAALMARTLLWVVREDRVRALGELDTGMELLRGRRSPRPTGGCGPLCTPSTAAMARRP